MAFAARLPEELDAWLDEVSATEQRPKNAILITALEEYRQRREPAHVLRLADETAREEALFTTVIDIATHVLDDVPAITKRVERLISSPGQNGRRR